MPKPGEKKHQPADQYVSLVVHVRDWSEDGYGTLSFRLPVAGICWDNTDRPKGKIVLEDIYEVELMLEGSEAAEPDAHRLESDTWDRDMLPESPAGRDFHDEAPEARETGTMSLAHVNVDEGNLPAGSWTREWWYRGFYARWDESTKPRAYAVFRRDAETAGFYLFPALAHFTTISEVGSFIAGHESCEGTWPRKTPYE